MSSNEKLSGELLKAEGIQFEVEVARQLHDLRTYISTEQLKLRRLQRIWIAVAIAVQVLLWVSMIWFPNQRLQSPTETPMSTIMLVIGSLLPMLIGSGCISMLLLHMWHTSRKEAQQRLASIEEKLAALTSAQS